MRCGSGCACSTERKRALCAADASLCRRDAKARLACGRAAQAALSGSKRPNAVRTQDQRHVGFTPRDGLS